MVLPLVDARVGAR